MEAKVKDGARTGRGFSLAELKEAGLNARSARRNDLPTDVWRDTKYEENVQQLKTFAKSIKESPKKEQAPKTERPATRKTTKKIVKKKIAKKKTAKKKQKGRKK